MKDEQTETRVLVVTAVPIGSNSGLGVTLRNIWSAYPREHVCQLIVDRNEDKTDAFTKVIRVSDAFCRLPYAIAKARKKEQGPTASTEQTNANIRHTGFKAEIYDVLRGILDSWPINIRSVVPEISRFAPDVVYTCGGSIRVLKTSLKLARRYRIPVVFHIMDDWPKTMYTSSKGCAVFHTLLMHYIRQINRRSPIHFSVSEVLGEKYGKMFGNTYRLLTNPASYIADAVKTERNQTLQFVYAGSLSLHRWKSLLEIADVLRKYRENGYANRFDMYVPEQQTELYRAMFRERGAQVHSFVSGKELLNIYQNSDVMVLAESFEDNIVEFIKESFSTKIPEYMGTGNTLLAYMSSQTHGYRYLHDNELGVTASSIDALKDAVHTIFCDAETCKRYSQNALNQTKRCFSNESIQRTLTGGINGAKYGGKSQE